MGRLVIVCAIVAVTIWLVRAEEQQQHKQQQSQPKHKFPVDCEPCEPEKCPKAEQCEAGVHKDRCGCCYVCANKEGMLCEHPEIVRREEDGGRDFGRCGDNLQCVLHDTDGKKEAVCACTRHDILCGSNNVTYDNFCSLVSRAVQLGRKIRVANKGPCKTAPDILSPPENIRSRSGKDIALGCEARGYPIPTVEWTWTRVDGKTVYLPSDDYHVSVNIRGGPEKYQVTGWLQIVNLLKKHEGDYTCIAQNDFGVKQAEARVNVVDDEYNESVQKKNTKSNEINPREQNSV